MKAQFGLIMVLGLVLNGCNGSKFKAASAVPAGFKALGDGEQIAASHDAQRIGRLPASTEINLAVTLKLPKQNQLAELVDRLYTPGDALFHKFITPSEFASRFSPTSADVAAVTEHLKASGLSVSKIHSNHLVIDVSGSAKDVERAFNVELNQYQIASGKTVFAPSAAPFVPEKIAAKIAGVAGLSNRPVMRANARVETSVRANGATGAPLNGLVPSSLAKAYGLDVSPSAGAGQTIAVVEFDDYLASDIAGYAQALGITPPPIEDIYVDSTPYGPSVKVTGEVESTTDIELLVGMAPGAAKIKVYRGFGAGQSKFDLYNQIAIDNSAQIVSTSWSSTETPGAVDQNETERAIFMQMAAQGQSVFAATGDFGANDNTFGLSVSMPSSLPYVTAVGGTKLQLANGNYVSETSWNIAKASPFSAGYGGGGGISALWALPSWQQGLANAANLGSTTHRMTPDISLTADFGPGYASYLNGKWVVAGGTSFGTPVWAAFAAQVNSLRVASGKGAMGFMNPLLYSVASSCANCFHDIKDGSNNLVYPAVAGYDLSTGLGSMNGAVLTQALSGATGPTQTVATGPATSAPVSSTPTVSVPVVITPVVAAPPPPAIPVAILRTNFVSGIYYGALGTSTQISQSEIADFLNRTAGESCAQVAQDFLTRDDIQLFNLNADSFTFVNLLYKSLLGRTPDLSSLPLWVNKLDTGASRQSVADGFLRSAEFDQDCKAKYGFDRAGTYTTGSGHALLTPNQSTRPRIQFVNHLFNGVLKRAPAAGETLTWLAVANQSSCSKLAESFYAATNATLSQMSNADYVTSNYLALLNRPSDAGGLAGWTQSLDSGNSRQAVLNGFFAVRGVQPRLRRKLRV